MGEEHDAGTTGAERRTSTSARPLVLTKLRVPRRPKDLLARRRLVNFVHSNLERRLILISAPAGYGKTTLLTDFAHDTELPVCWYTLDTFDQDLHLFLEHLIEAIAQRFPTFGRRSRALLRETADPGANLYPLVATLVQEIYDTIPEYFFLVLDDHHAVEDQEQINEFLDLFITYVDENCRLIIASRTLPALPSLSLLVARRQAAGLSIDELRFTPQEIQGLAKQNYGVDVSLEQANRLAEHTGGWITGLLLTIAHRWEQAQQEVIVRGRINVDVYDYLSQQVLDRQPVALRDFLLASSVLDELSPDLCARVLEVEDPDRLMNQVRMRSLFVIEFEGEQSLLRYHDLFRGFLQERLRQEDNARFRRLTLRAAGVYLERGEWERAVSRYLLLEDYEKSASLIQQVATQMYETGRWDTLANWIDSLPDDILASRPPLLVQRGKVYAERGDYVRSLSLIDRAHQVGLAQGDRASAALALANKGVVLRLQSQYADAVQCAQEALELIEGTTPEEGLILALAYKNRGLCRFHIGQLAAGQQDLVEAAGLYQNMGNLFYAASVHHDMGLGAELSGNLDEAKERYQAALEIWQQLGNPAPWASTLNSLGVVHHLLGRYQEGQKLLEEALVKVREAGDMRVESYIWASLADLYRDLGMYDRARQAYLQALDIANRLRVSFIQAYGLIGLGTVHRLQGDLTRARKELHKGLDLAQKHGSAYEAGLCQTSLGILAIQRQDLLAAQQYLDQAIEGFETGGFQRELAIAYLHRARLAYLGGERGPALADLQRVLYLAGQLASDEFLVIEGQQASDLLRFARKQPDCDPALGGLLDRIAAHQTRIAARPEPLIQVERRKTLKIYALGPPRVEVEGQVVQWATTQSRDLFFCLLQHRQGLRKEEIGSIFWPDHPPHKLDGIFRSTLYRLRRAVFRESVVYDSGVYSFDRGADYWSDAEGFVNLLHDAEQAPSLEKKTCLLQEALSLYEGDYLEGVYADWCVLEREQLRELQLNAREDLAELHARSGHLQQAINEYQQLISEDPYRELAHRELMRCHYRLGDRIAAIRQYQSCVEILREDLGLSPAAETEALYLQIIS